MDQGSVSGSALPVTYVLPHCLRVRYCALTFNLCRPPVQEDKPASDQESIAVDWPDSPPPSIDVNSNDGYEEVVGEDDRAMDVSPALEDDDDIQEADYVDDDLDQYEALFM
jgi:hypothetical protein